MLNVTALLYEWSIVDFHGSAVVRGEIREDRRGRFRDGEHVRTSPVVSGPDRYGIVETRSGSRYKLVGVQVSG